MNTNKLSILLMCGFTMQVSLSQAQKAQTVDLLQTKTKNAIIQVIRTPLSPANPEMQTPAVFKDELLINGKKTALPIGEFYKSAAGDFVLTSKWEQVDGHHKTRLFTNTLKAGVLLRKAEIVIDEMEIAYFIGTRGNLLISNEYEQLGYEISVYSPELKKLNSYRPFGNKGFSQSLSANSENWTAYLFFPVAKDAECKLVVMETNTGRVVLEKYLPISNYTNLVIAGDKILVQDIKRNYSDNQLICYDIQGIETWRLLQTADALIPVTHNGKQLIFVMDGVGYRFIDLNSGVSGTMTLLSSIATGRMMKDYKLDVSPSERNGEVLLLVSKKNSETSSQHEVFRLSESGSVEKIQSISSKEEIVRFSKLSHAVLVTNLSNQILYSYEK